MGDFWVVGGRFDEQGGKPSYVVAQMASFLKAECLNGGTLAQLRAFDLTKPKMLVWMPYVDNEEEKLLPSIKEINPKLFLVSSKRVIEKDYTEGDVVGRLLKTKSNLGIMISKSVEGTYRYRLLDPLGNLWADEHSVEPLCFALWRRMRTLLHVTRLASVSLGMARPFEIEPAFIDLIREFGSEFAKYVNAINPNRFLGNAATRCSFGFPGVRGESGIFVTRRNVDKEGLTSKDFVEVEQREDSAVGYYGQQKPSVDTPIQLILFAYYRQVKYMLHGHVYVDGAPKTEHILPCGSIEEFDEIENLYPEIESSNFVVNLSGHGFLAFASDLDYLRGLKPRLRARPFPEVH